MFSRGWLLLPLLIPRSFSRCSIRKLYYYRDCKDISKTLSFNKKTKNKNMTIMAFVIIKFSLDINVTLKLMMLLICSAIFSSTLYFLDHMQTSKPAWQPLYEIAHPSKRSLSLNVGVTFTRRAAWDVWRKTLTMCFSESMGTSCS